MAAASSSKQNDRYPLFRTSIETLFGNWEALKLAQIHGEAGRYAEDKAKWMVGVVEDFFYTNDDLMGEEVADFMGEIMCQEMNTLCEDNSLIEIGDRLVRYFRLCKEHKEDELNQELSLRKHPIVGMQSIAMQQQASSSSSSDSEDDESEPKKKESSDSSDWDMDD